MIELLSNKSFLGNILFVYVQAGIILIAGLLVVIILHRIIGRRLKRLSDRDEERGKWWIASLAFRRVVVPLLYLAVIWISISRLEISDTASRIFRGLVAAIFAVIAVRTAVFIVDAALKKYAEKSGRGEDQKKIKPLLSLISFLFWVIAFIFLLDNLGFNISTLVAGLGVSGIAVAIAAQGILGDLFNYFVIFFDRPFELGDFVIFDDKMGSIEKIGIKTTRIRTLSGEELVVSNSHLVNARLHNYKRMERRRIAFRIGVTYQTKSEQLKEIPEIIHSIVDGIELCQFDRCHFYQYGDFALVFETVYYVLTPDYNQYMDVQQEINLKIYETFEEREIEFAYPTQTVYVQPSEE